MKAPLIPIALALVMIAACKQSPVAPRTCTDPQYRCMGIVADTVWVGPGRFTVEQVRCWIRVCDSNTVCTVNVHTGRL